MLYEALRRDVQFIVRHPTALFQCLWNSGWWYDCAEAEHHYVPPTMGWNDTPPWRQPGPKLSHLLEQWRAERALCGPIEPLPSSWLPNPGTTRSRWRERIEIAASLTVAGVLLGIIFAIPIGVTAAAIGVLGFATVWLHPYSNLHSRAKCALLATAVGSVAAAVLIGVCLFLPWIKPLADWAATLFVVLCLTEPGLLYGQSRLFLQTQRLWRRVRRLRRREKAGGRTWLRSLRPPAERLGSATITLAGRGESLTCAAISPDGRKVAAGTRVDGVLVWDVATGELLSREREPDGDVHHSPIVWVGFDSDGELRCASEMQLLDLDAASGAVIRGREFPNDVSYCRAVSEPVGPPTIILYDSTRRTHSLQRGIRVFATLEHSRYDAASVAEVSADLGRVLLYDTESSETGSTVHLRLHGPRA